MKAYDDIIALFGGFGSQDELLAFCAAHHSKQEWAADRARRELLMVRAFKGEQITRWQVVGHEAKDCATVHPRQGAWSGNAEAFRLPAKLLERAADRAAQPREGSRSAAPPQARSNLIVSLNAKDRVEGRKSGVTKAEAKKEPPVDVPAAEEPDEFGFL